MIEVEKVKPSGLFTNYIFKAIPLAFDESMGYYETLCGLLDYMKNTMIPALNNNADAVVKLQADYTEFKTEITNLFNQLQTYVDNYFDNLDVQEEINNKLDEMVTSGQLQELVDNYFAAVDAKIGDLNSLNTLDNSSITDAINSNNQLQQVFLGNGIVYDIPDDVGHVQGSCINDNLLYVAVQGTSPYGYIYVFNINTNSFVIRYDNVTMYHGNDLTYINGKLYIASYDSTKICIYDIANNTSSEINPFTEIESLYTNILAVEKYDDTHIICWLQNNYAQSLINDIVVKLNINTLEFTEIPMIDEYNLTKFNTSFTRQNLCISGNDIYFLLAVPFVIIHGDLSSQSIKLNKIYNLPPKDINGNSVGELESVATINNTNYPSGSIMITGRNFETFKNTNTVYNEDTINNYIFSPKGGNLNYPELSNGQYPVRGVNCFGYFNVSKTSSTLIEDGTSARPFKNLMRGINCITYNKYTPSILVINDSSSYYIPYLYGINGIEIMIQNNCNPILYIGDIENCNIKFTTSGNGTLTIRPIAANKRSTISLCNLSFLGASGNSIIFNNIQLAINNCSYITTRRCKFENTEEVSSGYAMQINDVSMVVDGFDSHTLAGTNKWVQIGSSSIIATKDNDVTKTGYASIITFTN